MADESEMVERVARALAALSLNLNGNDAPVPHEPIIDRRWQNFVPQALAAISAMREPTEAMIEACWPVYHVWGKDAPSPDSRPNAYADMEVKALDYWHAQIDAALNKGAHD